MLIPEANKVTDILLNHVADGISGGYFYGDREILKIAFNNNPVEWSIPNQILEKSESFIIRGKVETEKAKGFVLNLVKYAIENHKQITLYDGPLFKRNYFTKEINFDESKSFLIEEHNINSEQFLKVVKDTTEIQPSHSYLRFDYPTRHFLKL